MNRINLNGSCQSALEIQLRLDLGLEQMNVGQNFVVFGNIIRNSFRNDFMLIYKMLFGTKMKLCLLLVGVGKVVKFLGL